MRLKRYAVTNTGIASALEHYSHLMSAVSVIHERMNSHAVKKNRGTPALREADIQPPINRARSSNVPYATPMYGATGNPV